MEPVAGSPALATDYVPEVIALEQITDRPFTSNFRLAQSQAGNRAFATFLLAQASNCSVTIDSSAPSREALIDRRARHDTRWSVRRQSDVYNEEKKMAGNGIVEVTDANFDQDVLKSDKPVLVDFWATWCGPCRAIAPIVEELATEYQGKIKIGKMDVDSNSATPMRYKVTGIPTLLVFKGGQVVEQLVGYKPKDAIAQALNKHIG
jgi:thioredoxin 1